MKEWLIRRTTPGWPGECDIVDVCHDEEAALQSLWEIQREFSDIWRQYEWGEDIDPFSGELLGYILLSTRYGICTDDIYQIIAPDGTVVVSLAIQV